MSQAEGIWSVVRAGHVVAVNLGLAAIPVAAGFLVSDGLRRDIRRRGRVRWGIWGPLLLVWLVFLPNTCYLLTEWRHYLQALTEHPGYLPGHDDRGGVLAFLAVTAFYTLYSGLGLFCFFLAVWPLDRLARKYAGKYSVVWQLLLFLLCAIGVYLGLIERFESWDPVNPVRLYGILQTTASVPFRPALLLVIVVFAAALWLFYALFDIWMDGAAMRLSSFKARRGKQKCR